MPRWPRTFACATTRAFPAESRWAAHVPVKCRETPSLSDGLQQTGPRHLVIKERLLQRQSLGRQSIEGIGDFDDRCFAGAIARDRDRDVFLRIGDCAPRVFHALGGGEHLLTRGRVLEIEIANDQLPLQSRAAGTQLRLTDAAECCAPIESWNRDIRGGQNASML